MRAIQIFATILLIVLHFVDALTIFKKHPNEEQKYQYLPPSHKQKPMVKKNLPFFAKHKKK